MDAAIKVIGTNKFRNAGQVCISPTRYYVQENVYNKFVDGFTEIASSLKVGNGLDEGVQMGPADRRAPPADHGRLGLGCEGPRREHQDRR